MEYLKKVVDLVRVYDAENHVYFMSSSLAVHEQLSKLAPAIPRCMGHHGKHPDRIVERAVAGGCKMVQLFKPYFNQATVDKAKAAGLRCNVFYANDPAEAKKYFDMGIDTVLTDTYQAVSAGTGVK